MLVANSAAPKPLRKDYSPPLWDKRRCSWPEDGDQEITARLLDVDRACRHLRVLRHHVAAVSGRAQSLSAPDRGVDYRHARLGDVVDYSSRSHRPLGWQRGRSSRRDRERADLRAWLAGAA